MLYKFGSHPMTIPGEVTYDQRSTNENTAQYTTFGYREKYDLIDWVNYVEQQSIDYSCLKLLDILIFLLKFSSTRRKYSFNV